MKTIQTLMFFCFLFAYASNISHAQNVIVNASLLDGVEISKQNIFSFQIISNLKNAVDAQVIGSISFRGSDMRLGYTFNQRIQPGNNTIDGNSIHPVWTYSQNALKELFMNYNTLPAGTYQYCIKVIPKSIVGETDPGKEVEECVYQKNQELFLINLIEPENNAKIYEHNPALTWIANYSFSNELTYKIKVAEIKKGQNAENAITRNNPIYQENNLHQNSLIYPLTAKELEVFQPYAWTVDAYYKGILLGGAEPWRFTIIEDSLKEPIPREVSYLDIVNESGANKVWAVGQLKLKYILSESKSDSLSLRLTEMDGKEVKLVRNTLLAKRGDNRYDIDFMTEPKLKHLRTYSLRITNSLNQSFEVVFRFVNTDFID